jgi:hypothetical protein
MPRFTPRSALSVFDRIVAHAVLRRLIVALVLVVVHNSMAIVQVTTNIVNIAFGAERQQLTAAARCEVEARFIIMVVVRFRAPFQQSI